MNAPLWRPPGFGGPQYLYTIYIYSKLCLIFHQAFVAQLVERLISMQEDLRSNLGLPSGFCSFKILNYNAAKCL